MASPDKVRPAILWKSTGILLQRVGGFLVSIVLARLVAPEEFGLIAMMLLFTGLAALFVDSGFSSALIQKQDHSHKDECTVFWFNILAGTVAALCLIYIAPWIAAFYGHPILEPLTWIMAANLWIGAWTSVHLALLSKKLNFQIQTKASGIAIICSGLVAIILAYRGWGVWALAVQTITATSVNAVLIWVLHSWRPSRLFSLGSLKNLYQFGGYMFLSGLLNLLGTQLHSVLVGKFYSASMLGFFNRAASTKDLPQDVLGGIFSSIAFPLFSSYSNEKTKLQNGLRVAIVSMMGINLPIMFGLMVTADVLVPTLFGPRWAPSVPFLQILCGVGALWPLQLANLNVLKAQGHSKLFFKLGLIKRFLYIVIVVIASKISVIAMAWGMLIASVFAFFINAHYTQKFLAYGAWLQIRDIIVYVVLSILMAVVVFIAGNTMTDLSVALQLLVRIIVGFVFYTVISFAFRLEFFDLALNFIRKKKPVFEE